MVKIIILVYVLVLLISLCFVSPALAQENPNEALTLSNIDKLMEMSLEELLNVEIVSVSKKEAFALDRS